MSGWPSVEVRRPLIVPVIGGAVVSFVADFWRGGVTPAGAGFGDVSD
jgi:hypothetical protein